MNHQPGCNTHKKKKREGKGRRLPGGGLFFVFFVHVCCLWEKRLSFHWLFRWMICLRGPSVWTTVERPVAFFPFSFLDCLIIYSQFTSSEKFSIFFQPDPIALLPYTCFQKSFGGMRHKKALTAHFIFPPSILFCIDYRSLVEYKRVIASLRNIKKRLLENQNIYIDSVAGKSRIGQRGKSIAFVPSHLRNRKKNRLSTFSLFAKYTYSLPAINHELTVPG